MDKKEYKLAAYRTRCEELSRELELLNEENEQSKSKKEYYKKMLDDVESEVLELNLRHKNEVFALEQQVLELSQDLNIANQNLA